MWALQRLAVHFHRQPAAGQPAAQGSSATIDAAPAFVRKAQAGASQRHLQGANRANITLLITCKLSASGHVSPLPQ
ncbi:hypothetical protein XFF6991_320163 [Xanthomonas phaseoli pv. phaseoli]|uniref:Uncharacterized protein n=1 Tax=Xanthomonas campestris pv. phaseoli TaxID=317013 RepID=A0A7Z7NGW2_XANCH|nr:hypothetical protein XFF6991_320163 [Xanthomonas phaseoli pv. phaseoli]